jgi:phosphodiesterase/alkaline phosphatase D-like protein
LQDVDDEGDTDEDPMTRPILKLVMTTAIAAASFSNPVTAQVPPPAKKARRVQIVKAPELEIAAGHLTIITWTTNNPGGTDDHYGVVHYGTDPKNLNKTAKSPIRLNQGHPTTTFRVRLDDLESRTTYYYRVDSEQSTGKSDGVKSIVKKFTTPPRGERLVAYPKRG